METDGDQRPDRVGPPVIAAVARPPCHTGRIRDRTPYSNPTPMR
jgi:hypothetical protein